MRKWLLIFFYAPELYRLLTRAAQHVMGNINRAKAENHPDWKSWLRDLDEIQELLGRIEGHR